MGSGLSHSHLFKGGFRVILLGFDAEDDHHNHEDGTGRMRITNAMPNPALDIVISSADSDVVVVGAFSSSQIKPVSRS